MLLLSTNPKTEQVNYFTNRTKKKSEQNNPLSWERNTVGLVH